MLGILLLRPTVMLELDAHIEQQSLTSTDNCIATVLSLLNYSHTDSEGHVHWKDGEDWRGVIEWARHEGIEANISGMTHTKERLLYVAEAISKKHLCNK